MNTTNLRQQLHGYLEVAVVMAYHYLFDPVAADEYEEAFIKKVAWILPEYNAKQAMQPYVDNGNDVIKEWFLLWL